jgi:hypothetical protein
MKDIKVMFAEIIDELNYEREDIAFEKDGRLWIGKSFWEPDEGEKIKKVIEGTIATDAVFAIVKGYDMLKRYVGVEADTLGRMVDSAWMSGFSKE